MIDRIYEAEHPPTPLMDMINRLYKTEHPLTPLIDMINRIDKISTRNKFRIRFGFLI